MTLASNVWRLAGDPSSLGFAAAVGERCENTLTGIVYVKNDTGDTDWIVGSTAYGGGAGGGLADPGSNGILVRTALNTTIARTLTPDATIGIANGTGTGGNPTVGRAAITGDVAIGLGSNAATIAADAVTYAKMQNVSAASKLLGRGSAAGAGDPEELTLGTNLSMSGTTLNASGGSASLTLTEVEKDLGASPVTAGHFDITGLAGLTPNAQVLVAQKAAAYTGKGALFDEMEMDHVMAGGYVVDANTIRVYWHATGPVRGNVKFGWSVSS